MSYAGPLLLCGFAYLAAFWPGLMSNDSIDQWTQASTGLYNDWHPVFHSLYIWTLTQLWHSPAMVAVAQIVALALVSGWALGEIEQLGVPRWTLWTTAILFAIAPANGIMAITLWKDVPFSISILALTTLLIRIARTEGQDLNQPGVVIFLGITSALVALFRHNGPPTAFGAVLFVAFVYRAHWQRVLTSLLISVGLWLGVRGPLYDWVDASRQTQPGLLWPVLHQIAGHLVAGTPLSEEERHLLDDVLPVEPGWPYMCTLVDPISFNPRLNVAFASEHLSQLAQLAVKLALRNPSVTVDHLLCNSLSITHIMPPASPFDFYEIAALSFDDSGQALTQSIADPAHASAQTSIKPLIPRTTILYRWVRHSLTPEWQGIFWRPALYIDLGLLACAIATLKRKDGGLFVVLVPTAITSALLIVLTVGQSFRLVYSLYLVGFILIPLAWASPRVKG